MSLGVGLLIILPVILIVILPVWPYSRAFGPYPSCGLGVILLLIFALVLSGHF